MAQFPDQITSVVVSPGVTSIGNLAFTRFSKLIHVDIADSVVSIGEGVFLSVPASLTLQFHKVSHISV